MLFVWNGSAGSVKRRRRRRGQFRWHGPMSGRPCMAGWRAFQTSVWARREGMIQAMVALADHPMAIMKGVHVANI